MTKVNVAHIRIPISLHKRLVRDAERSGLTMNAEILRRLWRSYETDDLVRNLVGAD